MADQPEPVGHRILWNVRGGDIDEIVFRAATVVHIEQMDDRCWWIGIDLADGGYWCGNFCADAVGRMTFTEQEANDVHWDRDDTHETGDET